MGCPRKACYYQKWSLCEHLSYLSCLFLGSSVGVVCRIGLSELAHWDGVPLFASFYSQLVGTLIMGFTVAHKQVLMEHHVFLYQAITTGLCGSITSFSTWNQEAMAVLLQMGYDQPDNAARGFGWATTLLLGLGMSLGALGVGRHLAALSPWSGERLERRQIVSGTATTSISLTDSRLQCCHCNRKHHALKWACLWVCLTGVMVAGAGLLIHRWDVAFSILFAGAGTYCRWHLAPLNKALTSFKLGTFIVNVMGVWLLGGVLALQWFYSGDWVQQVLVGVGTGFCGCLTTVSTFIVELSGMTVRCAYLYAITSILAAQVGLLLILGPVQWTSQSLNRTSCPTGLIFDICVL